MLQALAQLLLETVFGALAELIRRAVGGSITRSADRRKLAGGTARATLRAVTGRVQNIGTEWSSGIAHIEPGGFRFVPAIGIVGDRRIEVLGVREEGLMGDFTVLHVTVASGELLWGVPTEVLEDVLDVVLPRVAV